MTSPYDAMVEQLTALGVPRAKAEAHARAECGLAPDPALEERQARDLEAQEKDEQRAIRKLLISFGFRVYWLSQARRSGQTPGLADLWCVHERLPIAFWWETKRQVGGRHSSAQVEFAWLNTRAGVASFSGDRYDAAELLVALELAEPGPFPPHPTPRLRAAAPCPGFPDVPPANDLPLSWDRRRDLGHPVAPRSAGRSIPSARADAHACENPPLEDRPCESHFAFGETARRTG